MTSPLFRPEAVEHATRRLCGTVVLATPLKVRLLGALLVLTIALALVFAASATYARKETVAGWLTPELGMVRVTAARGGTALTLLVAEGASVAAGTPLATMRLSSDTDQGDAGQALRLALLAQRDAAAARARTVLDTLDAEARRLAGERGGLAEELAALDRQMALALEETRLATAEAKRGRTMAQQGVLAKSAAEQRRQLELRARQNLAALQRSRQELVRAIATNQSRIASIPIEQAAARADAAASAAAMGERITQLEVANQYVVTSPIAGRIAALPAQAGQTLAPGAVVAVVTPADSRLIAELYVPSRAAGFVRPEQAVRLMYEAYPHERFGVGQARIETVSRTVLAPSEVALPGMAMHEPVFRVRAALAQDSVDAYGERIPLQPGMLLRADVVIDRRSLLEWLFDPILAVRRSG